MKTNVTVILLLVLAVLVSADSPKSIYEIPVQDIDGKKTTLKPYAGKVILVVNVASKCGLTPQYKPLQAIYEKYHGKGLEIMAFPCNQFGKQEPGTPAEIKEFCTKNYEVTFPLFAKLNVKGDKQHTLYKYLSGKDAKFPGDVSWNFGKFLVDRQGNVIKRFKPRVSPDSKEVSEAIEQALAKP